MKPLNPCEGQPLDEVPEQIIYHIWGADSATSDVLNPTKQQSLDGVQIQVLEQTKDKI